MKEKEFVNLVQQKVAVSSVGPSALRGQGAGVLRATQEVLKKINLLKIPNKNQKQFVKWLDIKTNFIIDSLPIENKPWGAARKALNLFLRDVFYNRYLFEISGIKNVETWLEIPLDSAVARGLRKNDTSANLPRWPGLKYLCKDVSDKFQEVALTISESKGISRVHLDMIFWLEYR